MLSMDNHRLFTGSSYIDPHFFQDSSVLGEIPAGTINREIKVTRTISVAKIT